MADTIQPKNELITQNDNQSDVITLDLDNNQISVNRQFRESLAKAPEVIKMAKKLVNTDVKDLTEDDMTNLRRDFKPIVKYQKQYDEFEKTMKRMLRDRDKQLVETYHKILSDAGFDDIPQLTKQFRAIEHDFKANRANMRWEEIHELFDASMTTYPEFQKFAPNTLGSFNFYRLHHPDLISEAKTKPVTKATKAQFNQDLYQYHEDMTRLLESTLHPNYYQRVIEQYADDPSTNNMLNLIQEGMKQQIQDENRQLAAQITPAATKLLDTLWYHNDKINSLLERTAAHKTLSDPEFQTQKLTLMRDEGEAILASLRPENFIKNRQINQEQLKTSITELLKNATKRIYQKLDDIKPKTADKPKQPDTPKDDATKNQAQPGSHSEPYSWVLDVLQDRHQTNIHDNDKVKVDVLADIMSNLTNRQSVWRQHVKSYTDIMNLVRYISNL